MKKVGNANIRESFFGGRTNNLRFWYEIEQDEKIEYKDVCSEYPYVLKNKEYPMGHLQVIQNNFDFTLEKYFGFVKCKILPPTDCFLPILPSRINKKLLFLLCNKCGIEKKSK